MSDNTPIEQTPTVEVVTSAEPKQEVKDSTEPKQEVAKSEAPTPFDITKIFEEIKKAQEQLAQFNELKANLARLEEENAKLKEKVKQITEEKNDIVCKKETYDRAHSDVFNEMIMKFPEPPYGCSFDTIRIVKCSNGIYEDPVMIFSCTEKGKVNNYMRIIVKISRNSIERLQGKQFVVKMEDLSDVACMRYTHVEICKMNNNNWSFMIVDDNDPSRIYGKYMKERDGFDASRYPFDISPNQIKQVV